MTHPSDKELDDYLRRESTVSEHYRALDADDVPAALDAAVLAQARAAVAPKKQRAPAWVRWGSPLALAASAVLIVAIVLEVGVQDELRVPAPQLKREATTSAVDVERADLSAPSAPAEIAESSESRISRDVAQRPLQAPPPPPQPAAAPQSQPVPAPSRARQTANAEPQQAPRREAEEVVVTGTNIRSVTQDAPMAVSAYEAAPELKSSDETRPAFGPRAPGAPRAVATDAQAIIAPQPYETPERWLDAIRKLRVDGKTSEADEQWLAFRRAYPDFEVRAGDTALPAPSR